MVNSKNVGGGGGGEGMGLDFTTKVNELVKVVLLLIFVGLLRD